MGIIMSIAKWLRRNTESLAGKTVAVTGSTGGIGQELCRHLATLGANLVLVDRNSERSRVHGERLQAEFPEISVGYICADMEDIASVDRACEKLKGIMPYAVILNAGAYSIPRHKCSTGYDNVFQINFVSPYYMVKKLLPTIRENKGKVIAVGSIAHNYSKTDPSDIDFSEKKRASLVYGNAKRYLMFSLYELFGEEKGASLAVAHPGITFTNITAHYPKLIFAVIKHPMKVIFMKPKKACLSILGGMFCATEKYEWIGPRLFDVWGYPKCRMLKTCSSQESKRIFLTAEKIYGGISQKNSEPLP